MKTALIIGGVIALVLAPAMRALRVRTNSRMTDEEYFAAARQRAIGHRLAKTALNERAEAAGE